MTTPPKKPSHHPPPPAKDGKGAGEPPFDDRPQHEDEMLSEFLKESDPEQKPGKGKGSP